MNILDFFRRKKPLQATEEGFFVEGCTEPLFGSQVGPAVLRTHPPTVCDPADPCVVHRPSDHHMRDWPLNWRSDRKLMERICPHDIGHPDPDDLLFHIKQGRAWQAQHGCDGCCSVSGEVRVNG